MSQQTICVGDPWASQIELVLLFQVPEGKQESPGRQARVEALLELLVRQGLEKMRRRLPIPGFGPFPPTVILGGSWPDMSRLLILPRDVQATAVSLPESTALFAP